MEIREVLQRRSDLSTFVVHLTRDYCDKPAFENLLSILQGKKIEARSPMGWMVPRGRLQNLSAAEKKGQLVVSFSETPIQHVCLMCEQIEDREIEMKPYGIAFTKKVARRRGVNPVWYVDRTGGQDTHWRLARALDQLADSLPKVVRRDILEVVPFIEAMGTWPKSRKEFWWEREWRFRGDFEFDESDVAFVLCPEDDQENLRSASATQRPLLDASWSLERMLAHLAGVGKGDVEVI